ncbi:MAG: hypothetical protein K9M11_04045 [Candidatus Pacebacteria bacterium]|nr:hypothetical protein [Candidatus Paceibacterota bacterium]
MNREYHQARSVLATHVTPAILTKDYKDLVSKLQKISSVVDWVQIDVVDGMYAPNTTWPFVNDEKGIFASIVRQDEPMPYWDELSFEIDLMVKDPVFEVDRWIAAGAMRLVIHIDSIEFDAFVNLAKNIDEKGVEMVVGFAMNSSYEKLAKYIDGVEHALQGNSNVGSSSKFVNWVQCMGIDQVGYQRQAFDEKVLDHIKKIKELYPYMFIAVDGSVNMNTAQKLIDVGADRLVIGSALFEVDSLKDSIVQFSDMFNK